MEYNIEYLDYINKTNNIEMISNLQHTEWFKDDKRIIFFYYNILKYYNDIKYKFLYIESNAEYLCYEKYKKVHPFYSNIIALKNILQLCYLYESNINKLFRTSIMDNRMDITMFLMNLYKTNKKYKPIDVYYVCKLRGPFSHIDVYTFAPYSAYKYLASCGYPALSRLKIFI